VLIEKLAYLEKEKFNNYWRLDIRTLSGLS